MGASSAERETAAFRMREVTAAWEVLRSPAARARYDENLAAPSPAGDAVRRGVGREEGAPGAGTLAPVRLRPVARPEPDAVPLESSAAEPENRRRIRWHLPLALAVGAVVVTVVVGALAWRPEDGLRVRTVEPFAVGSCVAIVSDASAAPEPAQVAAGAQARPVVVEVPCSGPRSGRVVDRQPFPRPCPAGSHAFVMPDGAQSLCLVP